MARKTSSGGRLIAHLSPKSPITEAYRILRTNIQFLGVDAPIRTLVVTSSGPQEGKSTTAGNLGITLAQTGTRVLMVDADLRRPTLHKMFGQAYPTGLTSVLRGDSPLQDAVQATEIENLFLLTSGPLPPNPVELLNSERMRSLVATMKESYDMVIFDSPPAAVMADAAILSSLVDGAIIVINHGQITPQQAQRAQQMLENAKARILGVVLNDIPASGSDAYYYYYYYGRS